MIRVKKTMPQPDRLKSSGCNDDTVIRQINADQYGKCYLCESRTITDFEVEHRHSVAHCGGKNDWNNIFLACSYCNDKKGARFDGIVNPSECNVEDIIEQRYDAISEKFVFNATQNSDSKVELTLHLLEKIFNGANPKMLKLREENFRRRFLYEYNGFVERLERYLKSSSEENKQSVLADLDQSSEYLGFKYHIIMSEPKLADKFRDAVKWNKI